MNARMLGRYNTDSMTDYRLKVFISYARVDYKRATELFMMLERIGCEPWLDTESLVPGQEWEQIRECPGRRPGECHRRSADCAPSASAARKEGGTF